MPGWPTGSCITKTPTIVWVKAACGEVSYTAHQTVPSPWATAYCLHNMGHATFSPAVWGASPPCRREHFNGRKQQHNSRQFFTKGLRTNALKEKQSFLLVQPNRGRDLVRNFRNSLLFKLYCLEMKKVNRRLVGNNSTIWLSAIKTIKQKIWAEGWGRYLNY